MDLYRFLKKFRKSRLGRLMGRRTFTATAAIVVFVTTYALILPAITQTTTTYCGKEEHTHTEACYTTEKVLICDKEESDGHVHTDDCYQTTEKLVCGQEENDGHVHTDACYTEESELTCTNTDPEHVHDESCYTVKKVLTCGKEEGEGAHHHTADCYEETKELVCGKEEGSGAHHHTDACYKEEKTLTCTKEEHTHDKVCYANPNADTETAASWTNTMKGAKLTGDWAEDVITIAKTQLGYKESTKNYVLDSNGKKKGYTRYGAWYGNSYGDWCAMFCSFCINYADIPTGSSKSSVYMPIGAGCQGWIEKLNTSASPYYYAVNDKNGYSLVNGKDSVCWENPETEIEAYKKAHADDGTDLSSITIDDVCGKYHPQTGDLIFFNWDGQADADHVGLIESVSYASDGSIKTIHTIEGNSSNSVKENSYKASNSKIMGFASMPENPKLVKAEEGTTTETTVEVKDIASDSAEMTAEEAEEISDVEVEEKDEEPASVTDESQPSETTAQVEADDAEEQTATAEMAEGDETDDAADDETESFTLTATADDGVVVYVTGKVTDIPIDPERITLTAEHISQEAADKLASDLDLDESRHNEAYIITLWDGDTEIEPTGTVHVTFEGVENLEDLQAYHIKDDSSSEQLNADASDDGTVKVDMDGFSIMLLSTGGDTVYSSDLSKFMTGLTMTDGSGNQLNFTDSSTTVYVGETYTFSLNFAETNSSDSRLQFTNNSNGYLTYTLDTTNLELVEYSEEQPITNGDGVIIGYYTLTKNTEGKYEIKVRFLKVDDRGNATDDYYFNNSSTTAFNINFKAKVTASSDSSTMKVDFTDEIKVNATISKAGALSTEKTASYRSWYQDIVYQYTVKATAGTVSNVVSTDVSDQYLTIDTSSIKVYELDGTTERTDITATYDSTTKTLTTSATTLSAGEGYIVKYTANPNWTQYAADNNLSAASVSFNVDNTVTVTGDTQDGDHPKDTDSTTTKVSRSTLQKAGTVIPLRNDAGEQAYYDADGNIEYGTDTGNPVYVIEWTVTVGDGKSYLGDVTLTDAYDSGLTIYTGKPLEVTFREYKPDSDGNYSSTSYVAHDDLINWTTGTITRGSDSETPGTTTITTGTTTDPSGKTTDTYNTFSIALNSLSEVSGSAVSQYTVTYYTLYDGTKTSFNNQAYTRADAGDLVTTSQGITGGVGVIKDVTGSDADYIYYKVIVTVPAGYEGKTFMLGDSMAGGGQTFTQREGFEDEQFSITTASGKTIQVLDSTQTDDTDAVTWTYYLGNYYINFIARYEGSWPTNEASTLTFTYKISKLTQNRSGDNIHEIFSTGGTVSNTANVTLRSLDNTWLKAEDTAYYSEDESLYKYGVQDGEDIVYTVDFKNTVSAIAVTHDGTKVSSTSELSDNFSDAYITDTYDPNLTLDEQAMILPTFSADGTTTYKAYAMMAVTYQEGTALENVQKWQSGSKLVFFCPLDKVVVDAENHTLTAKWSDFMFAVSSNGTYYVVDSNSSMAQIMNLEELMSETDENTVNAYYNVKRIYHNSPIQFTYYMKPVDLDAVATSSNFSNTAQIGWNITSDTEGGNPTSYTTPTASSNTSYSQEVISKTGSQTGTNSDVMNYTITVNPNATDLTTGQILTVEDSMSSNLVLNYSSITIKYLIPNVDGKYFNDYASYSDFYAACATSITADDAQTMWNRYEKAKELESISFVYDDSDPDDVKNLLTFTVADNIGMEISYKARISTTGDSIEVSNSAKIVGYAEVSSATDAKYKVDATSGSGSSSISTLTVLKQDADTGKALDGAVFALYGPNDSTKVVTAPDGVEQTITSEGTTLYYYGQFTVGSDGNLTGAYVLDDNKYLTTGCLYTLVEVKAPNAYDLADPVSFWWGKAAEGSTLKVYQNGDTCTVQDELIQYELPKTGGMGTTPFTIAGLLLMAGAALMLFLRPKGKTGKM